MGILGISGYHTPSINQLIAAYGNDIQNVSTGTAFGVPLTSTNNVEFENYLQSLFFQNYVDTPLSYNGTQWSRKHVGKLPLSKYIKGWKDRLYIAYVKIGSVEYPSRVWFSDLPINDTIEWGYEQGTNLVTTASQKRVASANAGFKGHNIKRGDPFFITSGVDAGEYSVETVISDQWIDLADYNGNPVTLKATATGVSYWVGGNFFDVARDDGDYITWVSPHFSQFLVFKRDSLHRYNGQSLEQVPDSRGTTSGRSVQQIRAWTVYFYGGNQDDTGFYAYDGTQAIKISNGIQKYIDGINLSNQPISWCEGNLYRCYVGDISNTDYNISISNAVITYDYASKAWSVDPIADAIQATTQFRQGNTVNTFITNATQVFQTPLGNTFDGASIPFRFQQGGIFPSGTLFSNTFTRIQILSENAVGVKVLYKRRLKPFDSDKEFRPLGTIYNESSWFTFPEDTNQSSGIDLAFEGTSSTEPTAIIKKYILFYVRGTTINGQ